MLFPRIAILGVGLIGASTALAVKARGMCRAVLGYGRNEANLRRAVELGIIDDYRMDPREICSDADLVILATPVGTFGELVRTIAASLKRGAVMTDVGSVKGKLVSEIESLLPDAVFYVGSHPIAGSDRAGIDDAREDLFDGALCIVTPTGRTDREMKEKVAALWEGVGCRVEFMDPQRHDEVYGAVSHLPHVVAYALVNAIADFDAECIEYAGQGFKDTTRIALSSPELWRDIAILNRETIVGLIEILKQRLTEIENLLASSDGAAIEREFSRARSVRSRLTAGTGRFLKEDPMP